MNIWTHFAASTFCFFPVFFCLFSLLMQRFPVNTWHLFLGERSHIMYAHCCIYLFLCAESLSGCDWYSLSVRWWGALVFCKTETQVFGSFSRPSRLGCFWGRHLEASASFQLLPVSLRCLGFLTAFIYPAALYLGPSSPWLSINSEIRERRGSEWLV